MSLSKKLLGSPPEVYGESFSAHALEIYKLYVEMTDRVSSRRQTANSFFLTLNTGLITFVGYAFNSGSTAQGSTSHLIAGLAGIVVCFLWYRIIKSFRDLNSARFAVIHEIEKLLPLRPY